MIDSSGRDKLDPNTMPLKQAMLLMRIIWAALLAGECMFMAVIAGVILPHRPKPLQPQPVFVWVSWAMCLTAIPVTFAIRAMIIRKSRAGGALRPAAYSTGNIIFWAGCEAVAFFGLVAATAIGSLWPTIMPVAIAMGLQAITFPTAGKLTDA